MAARGSGSLRSVSASVRRDWPRDEPFRKTDADWRGPDGLVCSTDQRSCLGSNEHDDVYVASVLSDADPRLNDFE